MTSAPTAFQDNYPPDLAHCFGCGHLNRVGHHIRTFWDDRQDDGGDNDGGGHDGPGRGAVGGRTITRFTPAADQTAIPGYVYGGLLASLVDCAGTGSACGAAYRHEGRTMGEPADDAAPLRFVTGRLEVDYLAPTPMGVELVVRGRIDEVGAKKVVVSLEVFAGDALVVRGRVIAVRMPDTMGAGSAGAVVTP